MFSSIDAHEMMMLMVMPCYDHAQMMLKCKVNTWGVTTLPPYKNLVPRFESRTIFHKKRNSYPLNNPLFPKLHHVRRDYSKPPSII
jgi:hypothetical protein